MKLKDAMRGRAIHMSGGYFLDSPGAEKRFVVIGMIDSYHGAPSADDYSADPYAEVPEGFPEDGWISLDNGE